MDLLTLNEAPGDMPPTFYADTVNVPTVAEPARGSLSCDICVVGGGFTGLSTALHAAQLGLDVILLEARQIGFGASARNGGQIGPGFGGELDDVEDALGEDKAFKIWKTSVAAVDLVNTLSRDHNIQCDLKWGHVTANHHPKLDKTLQDDVDEMAEDYDYDKYTALTPDQLRDYIPNSRYSGGLFDSGSGHLNPLKFLLGLRKAALDAGVRIFENSRVTDIENFGSTSARVTTDQAIIRSGFVSIGVNGYITRPLHRKAAQHVVPINSFIVASRSLTPQEADQVLRKDVSVSDTLYYLNYFRLSEDNRMLFGGGGNASYRFPKDIKSMTGKRMRHFLPAMEGIEIEYAWGGTLAQCMNDIGYFARPDTNIMTSGGYSGHGVAISTMMGKLMANVAAGKHKKFDLMAQIPTPRIPGAPLLNPLYFAAGTLYYQLRDHF